MGGIKKQDTSVGASIHIGQSDHRCSDTIANVTLSRYYGT